MDASDFANQVSAQIETLGRATQSDFIIGDLVVQGRVHFSADLFLSVYYNEFKGTIGFALIHKLQRIWGIDYDNAMSWHRHPLRDTQTHEPIAPQTIAEILSQLKLVLDEITEIGN